MEALTNYELYRGKCKEFVEAAIKQDTTLIAVRGFYHDPLWGKQQHWWCKRANGTIFDPTAKQFPSKGSGDYEEFDGFIECEECGKRVPEQEAYFDGHHAFCSYSCNRKHVGL